MSDSVSNYDPRENVIGAGVDVEWLCESEPEVCEVLMKMHRGERLSSRLYGGGDARIGGMPVSEGLMNRLRSQVFIRHDPFATRVNDFVWQVTNRGFYVQSKLKGRFSEHHSS